jgi:hypothetical protein
MARPSSVRRASGVSASSHSAVTTACIFVSQYPELATARSTGFVVGASVAPVDLSDLKPFATTRASQTTNSSTDPGDFRLDLQPQ